MVRNNNCLLSSIFPAGEGGVSVPRRSSQDYRDGFFWYTAQASFSWGSSLSRSVGFVSLSGKASLVSISAAILFLRSLHVYIPLEFEFRGKSCVESEDGGEDSISCLLPCILLLYIE